MNPENFFHFHTTNIFFSNSTLSPHKHLQRETRKFRDFLQFSFHKYLFLKFYSKLSHTCTKETYLSSSETHDPVHGGFIDLMKLPKEGKFIFWYQHQTISYFDVVLVMKGRLL